MSTPRAVAVVVGSLIALLLWGSVSASMGSLPPPSAPAAPALRGTPNRPFPTPTPTATRKRITFPGPAGTRLKIEPEATPTRRFRPNDGIVALTPGGLAPECVNQAALVSPAYAEVTSPPNAPVQVIVSLKNTSHCTWGPGYTFSFQQKEDMNATPLDNPAPPTAPGESASFVESLVAPGGGTHVGLWQMRAPDGVWFGPTVYIIVKVTG